MKRTLCFLLTILLLFAAAFSTVSFAAAEPEVEATTACLIDAHSGEVLWEKNMDVQMAPASMTKMMTAILAVENLDMDTVVSIDKNAAHYEYNSIDLKKGEELTVRQLVTAMLTGSLNDCAIALADTMSGSEKDFANMMNGRARELGCKNTNFVNSNGMPDKDHLSTAYDMALITKKFMEYDELRKICKLKRYTLEKTNKSAERKIVTTNRLLYDKNTKTEVNGKEESCYYKYAIGTKTGYTQAAQGCLAATAVKDGTELISVVIHSEDIGRFGDTKSIFKYGFKNFKTYNIYEPGDKVGKIKVKGSKHGKTACETAYYASANLTDASQKENITTDIDYVDKVIAPAAKGTYVGKMKVYNNNKLVSTVDVVTAEPAEEGVFSFIYTGHVAHPFQLALVILLIIVILFALFIILLRMKYAVKKAQRRKRRRNS